MEIKFNLEASDVGCAFLAIYAGLRMYKEQKDLQPKEAGTFSIAAAEAYCRLQDLKEQYPEWYAEAETEYNEVYGKIKSVSFEKMEVRPAIQQVNQ